MCGMGPLALGDFSNFRIPTSAVLIGTQKIRNARNSNKIKQGGTF